MKTGTVQAQHGSQGLTPASLIAVDQWKSHTPESAKHLNDDFSQQLLSYS